MKTGYHFWNAPVSHVIIKLKPQQTAESLKIAWFSCVDRIIRRFFNPFVVQEKEEFFSFEISYGNPFYKPGKRPAKKLIYFIGLFTKDKTCKCNSYKKIGKLLKADVLYKKTLKAAMQCI